MSTATNNLKDLVLLTARAILRAYPDGFPNSRPEPRGYFGTVDVCIKYARGNIASVTINGREIINREALEVAEPQEVRQLVDNSLG